MLVLELSFILQLRKQQVHFVTLDKELGVGLLVHYKLKFHAELAGEEFEHGWGIAKGQYRKQPLQQKYGREATTFKTLEHHCVGHNLLTNQIARRCASKARAYLLAY